jgi:hypothetical protein
MRRIASHYIYWRKWYRMHYLELDAKGRLTGVYPLVQEIANTEFYDGTLLPVPSDITFPPVGSSGMIDACAACCNGTSACGCSFVYASNASTSCVELRTAT